MNGDILTLIDDVGDCGCRYTNLVDVLMIEDRYILTWLIMWVTVIADILAWLIMLMIEDRYILTWLIM